MIKVTVTSVAGAVRTEFECSECGGVTHYGGLAAPSAGVAAYLEAVLAGTPPDISTRPAAE